MPVFNLARGALRVIAGIATECVRPRRRACYWGGPGCFVTRDPFLLDAHHNDQHRGDTPRTRGYRNG